MPTFVHNRFVARPSATLQPLVITTVSLPGATTGSDYSATLVATGGRAPYTWSVLSAVPNSGAWLSCSSGGVLSGVSGTAETELILVQVIDAQGTKASAFLVIAVSGSSWQLPLSHSVVSPVPLTLVAPRTGMVSLAYGKTYPGLLYRRSVVCVGGRYPYQYALSGQPSGMTVGQHYGDTDYGVINWPTPIAGSYSYTVTVTDQAGTSVSTGVSLTVTTIGFIFFDAVNGHRSVVNGGTADGSVGNPFSDLDDWYSGATGHSGTQAARKADATYRNSICYYKNGNYGTTNCAPFESQTTGTGYSGWRVPMVTNNKPKTHLAYPGHSPVIDVTSACLAIYGDNGYGWWMQGISSAGVGPGSDYKFIEMDSGPTDIVLAENVFASMTGVGSTNPTPFMIRRNTPNYSSYVALVSNVYQGVSNAELAEFYDTIFPVACHRNSVSNSSEGNGGGFYFKEDCQGFSVWGNTGSSGNSTCLVRYDNFSALSGGTTAEIGFNNYATSGPPVLFGTDGGVNYGTVALIRNTWQGIYCQIQINTGTASGIINVNGDVNIGDGTRSNNWSSVGWAGTTTFDSTYLTGTVAAGITDSSGNLQGASRTSNLGISGHEVA